MTVNFMAVNLINLDANATYGVLPEVREEIVRAMHDQLLNPSSVHRAGQRSRALIEDAREEIGRLLGLTSGERIVFNSGATESNNAVVEMARRHGAGKGGTFVISAIEHPSMSEPVFDKLRINAS